MNSMITNAANANTAFNAKRSVLDQARQKCGARESLEAYTREELTEGELIAALLRQCDAADTNEEALSLLDQYHRRGLIETSLLLTAKTELRSLP